MSGKTKIEWADRVWNPTVGCAPVSEGCRNCYAKRMFERFYQSHKFEDVTCHPERLNIPEKWIKPQRIFVDSMSDLFHEDVPDDFIWSVFSVMAVAEQHQFMVLTKRPERMCDYLSRWNKTFVTDSHSGPNNIFLHPYPLPNVWLGVSVEDQKTADERIPLLLQTPAAKRFVSVEPMVFPVNIGMSTATCDCCERWSSRWVKLNRTVTADFIPIMKAVRPEIVNCKASPGIYRARSNPHGALNVQTPGGLLGIKPSEFECLPKLDWVICGGESGPGAHPLNPMWVRELRDQCVVAGVPFFFKQWGEWMPSTEMTEEEIDSMSKSIAKHLWPDNRGGARVMSFRVGKKKAGQLLDGRVWNEFPGGE